jgi:hypothetical protein
MIMAEDSEASQARLIRTPEPSTSALQRMLAHKVVPSAAVRPKLIFEVEDLRDDLPGFVGSTLALEEL